MHVNPNDTTKNTAPELPDEQPSTEVPAESGALETDLVAATDDAETDTAIDDLLKEESDTLLAIDSEKPAVGTPYAVRQKPTWWQKFVSVLQLWWYNKWARWGTIIGFVLLLVAIFAVPYSRYFVLNTVGVRAGASVTILDGATDLPLKNVTVKLGGAQAKTNEQGEAVLTEVRLGSQDMVVTRIAFAELRQPVTVGWGSNPFGELALTATGSQYSFTVTDFLSGKPIEGAEAVSGQASAFADKDGLISLVLDDPDETGVVVTVGADEYRSDEYVIKADQEAATAVALAPAQPVVYVSKQSGTYDVYRMDVDGKNKKLVLAGTGNENQDIRLVVSADGNRAAISSIRSTARDSAGYPLRSLTVVDLKSGTTKAIDQAQYFSFVNWDDSRLVYQVTYAAPSAATNQRQRLIAYDTADEARTTLVTTDYFTGFVGMTDYIYYAIAPSDTTQPSGFYRIKSDGSAKQQLLDAQIWGLVRTSVSAIAIETPNGWYDYTLGTSAAQKGNAPTNLYTSRNYTELLAGSGKSLWLDERDGKMVVLLHDKKSGEDKVIVTGNGISLPIRWLSSTAFVYRVQSSAETADYAQSIAGGDPRKLTDVTATIGFTTTLY